LTTTQRTAATLWGAAVTAGLGALAWGGLVEVNRFRVRHEVLPLLDPGAASITVLHLADIHLAPWQRRKQEWLRSLANLKPDLIVNTGDNLGHSDAGDAIEYALAPFAGTPGVFVHGSNDYFGPRAKSPFAYFSGPSDHDEASDSLDTGRLDEFFENKLGWLNLNNAAAALTLNGSALEFFGVNDAHRGWDDLAALPGAIESIREEQSWDEDPLARDPLSIAVTHAPYRRVLDSFVTNGAELIFAGHTHGGQVRIPGMKSALVNNCDLPLDQSQGLSVWSHARRTALLNVSAGIGTSIYAPVRFACPPEAVVVTLTASDIRYS